LKVERGKPAGEGQYNLQISLVRLLQEGVEQKQQDTEAATDQAAEVPDLQKAEKFFEKTKLGKILVKSDLTLGQFRKAVYDQLIANTDGLPVEIAGEHEIRMRHPREDDLGDVMREVPPQEGQAEKTIGSYYLSDGKDFLVQKIDENSLIS